MAYLRNLLHQATLFLVCVEMLLSYCSAACDVSDISVVFSGGQAESEAWLETLKKTGKRPLHMHYYYSYPYLNFTGIVIPDNNSGWIIDWGRFTTSYKTRRCAKWNSGHYDNSSWTVIEMNEACNMDYSRDYSSTADGFQIIAAEKKADGYVLKSVIYANGK